MAHVGQLPTFQRLITTHNNEGKAILSDAVDETAVWDGNVEGGKAAFCLGYSTSTTPVNLNDDHDIQKYKEYLVKPPGLVEKQGSVLRFVVRIGFAFFNSVSC